MGRRCQGLAHVSTAGPHNYLKFKGGRRGKAPSRCGTQKSTEKPNVRPLKPTCPLSKKEVLLAKEGHAQTEVPEVKSRPQAVAPGIHFTGPLSSLGPSPPPPAPGSHLTTLSRSPTHPGMHNDPQRDGFGLPSADWAG